MSERRNEPARSRHRRELQQRYDLTALPRSELVSEDDLGKRSANYNLNNNFGWTVFQKSYVDDSYFPNIPEYLKKPEIPGREDQRVTYILVMREGTVIDSKDTSPKETQTIISGVQVEDMYPERRVVVQDLDQTRRRHEKHVRGRRRSSCFGRSKSRGSKESRDSKGSQDSEGSYKKSKVKDRLARKSSKDSRGSKGSQSNGGSYKKTKKRRQRKGRRRSSQASKQSDQSELENEAVVVVRREYEGEKKRSEKKAREAMKKEMDKLKKQRRGPDRWQMRAPAGAEAVGKNYFEGQKIEKVWTWKQENFEHLELKETRKGDDSDVTDAISELEKSNESQKENNLLVKKGTIEIAKCDETQKLKDATTKKKSSKFLEALKFTPALSKKPVSRLMETASGKNQYLYVGKCGSKK